MKDVTEPTCLETSIAELWAQDANFTSQKTRDFVAKLSKQEIINAINEKEFSEVFLFDKNFEDFLGGITRNSSGHIIGAKATVINFFGQIDIDALTEDEIKFNTNFGPPVSYHEMIILIIRKYLSQGACRIR